MTNLLTNHIARTLTFAVLAAALFAVSTALISISAAAQEAPEMVVFDLEKKFSGPVPDGYTADQFSFQIDGTSASGTSVSETVSLTEHTDDSANGTVELPEGTYTLSEIGPDGFVPEEWRVQWTGAGCEDETAPSTVITVEEDDLGKGNFGCRADNQWFPDDATDDDDDDGGDDDNGDGGNGGNGGNGGGDVYRIEGYVWHDNNENSEWEGFGEEDPEENSQSGWEVEITNGTDTFATTTDEDGFYYFEVPAGTWTITEILQEGWTLITPSSGSHVVTVPEATAQSFVERVFAYLMPHTHAAVIDTFGPFNFGNNQSNGSGGNGYSQGSYGGGGGAPDPSCDAFTLTSSGGDDILEWETSRGDDLRITEDGTEIFTTDDDAVVDQGSHNLGAAAAALYELEVTDGNDGDTCEVDNRGGGGGGGGNASGSGGGAAEPTPEVLGEQVSVVPAGAPQTGAGGAAPHTSVVVTALLALIAALGMIFATRRHGA